MAGMSRIILGLGFAVAGLPFTGMVGSGVRYALRSHDPDKMPSWYGWIFATAALLAAAAFGLAAFTAVTERLPWRTVFRATLAALPVAAVATLGSLLFVIPLAILVGIVYLLTKRTSRDTA
jgi:hypothetical protein